jgi:hypothetical protein
VRVRWHWGGAKPVEVFPYDSVGEAIANHGFQALPDTDLFIAHRGQIIDPCFSFQFHEITSGSLLVCLLKKRPIQEKFDSVIDCSKLKTERYRRVRLVESSRQFDMSFANWECHPRLPVILRELMNELGGGSGREEDYPTVIQYVAKISETPLPSYSRREGWFSQGSQRMGGALGFVKDKRRGASKRT